MIRLRRGKVPRFGAVSGGNSLITAPPWATIARASPRWAAGYSRRCPPPITATVVPPARSVAAWAAASIPSARPETTVAPRPATASAILPLVARPTAVGRRVPTMATDLGRSSAAADPATYSTGGGSSIAAQPRRVVGVDERHGPHARPVERARAAGRDPPPRRRRPSRSPTRATASRRRARRRRPPAAAGPRGAHGLAQDAARVAERRDQPRERHGPDALDGVEHDPRVALAIAGSVPAVASAAVPSARRRRRAPPASARRGARRRRVPRRASASRPHRHPVHRRPEAGGLVEMLDRDGLRAGEVRDRARDAEQPLGPAAGQPLALRERDRPGRGDLVEAARSPAARVRGARRSASRPSDRAAGAGRPRCARPPARTPRARRARSAPPAGPDRPRPTGRSGRAAAPRPGAGTAPGRPADRCTRGRRSPAGRTGTGSSPPRT